MAEARMRPWAVPVRDAQREEQPRTMPCTYCVLCTYCWVRLAGPIPPESVGITGLGGADATHATLRRASVLKLTLNSVASGKAPVTRRDQATAQAVTDALLS